jgi:hypothetical protein
VREWNDAYVVAVNAHYVAANIMGPKDLVQCIALWLLFFSYRFSSAQFHYGAVCDAEDGRRSKSVPVKRLAESRA